MKKTVVLCEGPHDISLLSLILQRMDCTFQTRDWEDICSASRENQETTVISEFKSRRGRGISFLIKQDKDNAKSIESFWHLYEDYEGYDLKLVIDSDGEAGIRTLRRKMTEILHQDVLEGETDNENPSWFNFKGFGSERKPAVFLYPKVDVRKTGKLTEIIKDAGYGNLDGCRNKEEREQMINSYLDSNPDWISCLKDFLRK